MEPDRTGISVVVRIRPFNQREKRLGEQKESVSHDSTSVQVLTTPSTTYSFGIT
jgi:hypothetical protein